MRYLLTLLLAFTLTACQSTPEDETGAEDYALQETGDDQHGPDEEHVEGEEAAEEDREKRDPADEKAKQIGYAIAHELKAQAQGRRDGHAHRHRAAGLPAEGLLAHARPR